jgi:hypothetical protein
MRRGNPGPFVHRVRRYSAKIATTVKGAPRATNSGRQRRVPGRKRALGAELSKISGAVGFGSQELSLVRVTTEVVASMNGRSGPHP